MSLIGKHVAVLQAWACLDLVLVVHLMMQIKFNFNNLTRFCNSLAAC